MRGGQTEFQPQSEPSAHTCHSREPILRFPTAESEQEKDKYKRKNVKRINREELLSRKMVRSTVM